MAEVTANETSKGGATSTTRQLIMKCAVKAVVSLSALAALLYQVA